MFEPNLDPPKIQPADFAISVAKLIFKVVAAHYDPIFAIPATQIIDLVFRTPFEKRRTEAMEDQIRVLEEAAKRNPDLTVDGVANHEAYVSASIQAARIAFSTHHQEKREYLRNALLNVLLGVTPDETKQQIFFNAIEAFSPIHMKILGVISGEIEVTWAAMSPYDAQHRTFGAAIEQTIPKLVGQGPLVDAILNDLSNRGFTNVAKKSLPYRPGDVTNLGAEFFRFISEPPNSTSTW
jgi:hypothetical protein